MRCLEMMPNKSPDNGQFKENLILIFNRVFDWNFYLKKIWEWFIGF